MPISCVRCCHRVRHQAVDADRRQQQRRAAEHRHQAHVERSRDVERETTSSIDRMSDTGKRRSPRASSLDRRAQPRAARPRVRTTQAIGDQPHVQRVDGVRHLRLRRCTSSAAARWFSPPSRTSPTTPMICRSGSLGELPHDAAADRSSRSFSGSPFGQNCLRHRLVDDHDRRRAAGVALGEGAAALAPES